MRGVQEANMTKVTITATFDVEGDNQDAAVMGSYLFGIIVDTIVDSGDSAFESIADWDMNMMLGHTENCALSRDAGEPGSTGLGCDCGAEKLSERKASEKRLSRKIRTAKES